MAEEFLHHTHTSYHRLCFLSSLTLKALSFHKKDEILITFPESSFVHQIAASCVMLGFILARLPWPNLAHTTGFSLSKLVQPLVIIYSKKYVLVEFSER